MTEEGIQAYKNNRTIFGLDCGDSIITEEKEGVLLMYGLIFEFDTKRDYEEFNLYNRHEKNITDLVE